MRVKSYHYRACGLDNVIIEGIDGRSDDADRDVVFIPNIVGLHRLLASMIVHKRQGITPRELRFVRTEIGATQAELAELVKKDQQTIGRWERGETPIEQNAEFVVRMIARERLGIADRHTAEEIAGWCVPGSISQSFRIDGRNPRRYRELPAAA